MAGVAEFTVFVVVFTIGSTFRVAASVSVLVLAKVRVGLAVELDVEARNCSRI